MKKIRITVFPDKFLSWTRKILQVPPDVHVGEGEVTELLFTTLFPAKKYSGPYYSHFPGCWRCFNERGTLEVAIHPLSAKDAPSVNFWGVVIVDKAKGITDAVLTLRQLDLINHEDEVEKKINEVKEEVRNSQEKEQKAVLRMIVGFAIFILTFPALMYFTF